MSSRNSPIKDVLQTLSRHAETVEYALTEVVTQQSGPSSAAIMGLRQVSALRAAGTDGYRLHPRLREYLQDHLQFYPAFQNLAEIGSRITTMLSLWSEMDQMIAFNALDLDALDSLEASLRSGVFDIADSMERNLLLLQTRVSTRYGNVKSLALKKSQNRFYQQQTSVLAADMARLAKAARRIERESAQRGAEELAQFLRQHLISRMLPWQQGVSEMQTLIRHEIFRTRQIEQNHKQLARMDMLLRQQPAWRGIDAELADDVPAFLLATRLPGLHAQVEPLDSDRSMVDEMQLLVQALPPRKPAAAPSEPPKRYKYVVPEKKARVELPATRALNRLILDVDKADRGISLVEWQARDEDARTMEPGVWLVFAVMALRSSGGYQVNLALEPPRPGEHFSHRFHDAFAYTQARFEKGAS